MNTMFKVSIESIWKDFSGWPKLDIAWFVIALIAVLMSSAWQTSSTFDTVTALTNVICVLLVAKGRLSNFYWGLIGVTGMAVVAFQAKLYGTAILNVAFIGAQFWGWYSWYTSMKETGRLESDVVVNRLSLGALEIIIGCAGAATFVVGQTFMSFTDNHFPFVDAGMLVLSIIGTVLMVKHYAEQWIFWVAANLCCIYMWVLPALDGVGSLPIVVMWTVFTINSLYGLYKWYWLVDKK